MSVRRVSVGVAAARFALILSSHAVAGADPEKTTTSPQQPTSSASAGTVPGGIDTAASKKRYGGRGKGINKKVDADNRQWPKTKVIDCGPQVTRGRVLSVDDPACLDVRNHCAVASAAMVPKDPYATTTGTLRQGRAGAVWVLVSVDCNARRARPLVTSWLVREEIVKLVAPVPIGAAPPPGQSVLVNTQWIAWLPTAVDRDLGTVTLLGTYRVALRIHLDHVDWDFGDGATAVSTTPGKVYDHVHDRCHTAVCPEYLGHVYTSSGTVTATAAITWTGQYSVDGGRWQDVPGTVTPAQGPASLVVKVIEARSVLVPDPSPN